MSLLLLLLSLGGAAVQRARSSLASSRRSLRTASTASFEGDANGRIEEECFDSSPL